MNVSSSITPIKGERLTDIRTLTQWTDIDWKKVEEYVNRLQTGTTKAVKEQKWHLVRRKKQPLSTPTPIGYNTDGIGSLKVLKETVGEIKGKKVLILGAGGAAKAISFYLDAEGAKVAIANWTKERAAQLASKLLNANFISLGVELEKRIEASDILINATSVGMHPNEDATLVSADMMHPDLVVFDIVYNPMETKLLREAKRAGVKKIVDGVKMLVYQGAASFKIWTQRGPPIGVMENAVRDALIQDY